MADISPRPGTLGGEPVRLRCDTCALERLVPFSCKGRGFCPSCGGRRMTERAARLVATVEDPHAIRAILESLGLPVEVPQPDPPQPPPAQAGGLLANLLS